MKFPVSFLVFLKLFFLLQECSGGNNSSEDLALYMQKNVELLIEKIVTQIQDYHNEIKLKSKCIPSNISDELIKTLQKSVDCVHKNEKNYTNGKIKQQERSKNFLQCFSSAKKEVKDILKSIDVNANHCPENMTEKTYLINVTTTYSKTFNINIKNGLEVKSKKIEFFTAQCGNRSINASNRTIVGKSENTTDNNTTGAFENTTSKSFDIAKNTDRTV